MERIFNQSTWPKRAPKLEAAIGRFVIAWNILEQEIDFAIQEVCRLDFHGGRSITANLGTKAKLDIYQSLVTGAVKLAIPDRAFVETVNQLVGDTANASGALRNFLFHGQPTRIQQPNSKRRVDTWVKFSARKGGVKGTLVRLGAHTVDEDTRRIEVLVERWTGVRRAVHKGVEVWDEAERDPDYSAPVVAFGLIRKEHPLSDSPKKPARPHRSPRSSRGAQEAKRK